MREGSGFVVNTAGDASWDNIVRDQRKRLLLHARNIVGDHHDAEDVVQALLCRFWQNRGRLTTNVRAIESYLIVSVRNQARNLLRAKRTKRHSVSLEDAANSRELSLEHDPTSALEAAELASILVKLQSHLSPAQRRLYRILHDDPDQSGRKLALELGCSHKNVQGLLKRMRGILDSEIEQFILDR